MAPCWVTLRLTPPRTLRPPPVLSSCRPPIRVHLHPPPSPAAASLPNRTLQAGPRARVLRWSVLMRGCPSSGRWAALCPLLYCVLGGGHHLPALFRSYCDFAAALDALEQSQVVSHAWPSKSRLRSTPLPLESWFLACSLRGSLVRRAGRPRLRGSHGWHGWAIA